MKNLASIVTKESLTQALEDALTQNLSLIPSTKFHIVYKNNYFPPKEIVRLAAEKMGIRNLSNYRLRGGKSTNKHLEEKGFKIIQLADWSISATPNTSQKNEERIARLTYNTNGWQFPSGYTGKSRGKKAYETDHGFGHEEWLFDFTKQVDGYHYGYLEPINANRHKYEGQTFDVLLYTIDGITKQKFWVGQINNLEVIDSRTSNKIYSVYVKRGWYNEMKEDLNNVGLDGRKLDKWDGTAIFNIRFKPEDYIPFPENSLIDNIDDFISSFHYILLHKKSDPQIKFRSYEDFKLGYCAPQSRHNHSYITKKYEEKLIVLLPNIWTVS